jgi:hypothetical protein
MRFMISSINVVNFFLSNTATNEPGIQTRRNTNDDEDLEREILFKFDQLQKSYKNANIPEFSIHSDYNTMQCT